jgi:hypothetical protein
MKAVFLNWCKLMDRAACKILKCSRERVIFISVSSTKIQARRFVWVLLSFEILQHLYHSLFTKIYFPTYAKSINTLSIVRAPKLIIDGNDYVTFLRESFKDAVSFFSGLNMEIE